MENENPYKSSTEQERFARQLDRDLERNSQNLSQSVIRALLNSETAQWARDIYTQKTSQNNSTNISTQQFSQSFATTQTTESLPSSSIIGEGGSGGDGYATASSDTVGTGGTGLPEGALFKEFDVCENGNPTTYWFVVWNQEPSLEE